LSDTRQRTNRSLERTPIARHGQLTTPSRFLLAVRFVAATLVVVFLAGASVASIAVSQLAGNIESVDLVAGEGEEKLAAPVLGKFEGGFNLLIVGSDVCDNPDGCADRSAELNDVTMLLHVAEDQSSAVAVSIPRDLVVPIPSCPTADGTGSFNSMSAQPINSSLSYGGLACTVLTVEALTGLDIPYASLITFNGVIEMTNAVGGVDICIDAPIRDPGANGLNLPTAGIHTLQGESALGFLRSRYGVGDGSDLGRISSQQQYLSSLVRKVKSDSTLTDVGRLFGLAQAATANMKLSSSLANINTMSSMALILKDVPLEKITFVQYPGVTGQGGIYAGKVAPIKAQAEELFAKISSDVPFTTSGTGLGATLAEDEAPEPVAPAPDAPAPGPETPTTDVPVDPSAPPAAPEVDVLKGVKGQTAADETCAKAYQG
jgi:LCP family protein required for cell wall assembly